MKTIHAIYRDGVFQPTTPVELPEGCEVTIEPKQVGEPEGLSPRQGRIGEALVQGEDTIDPDFDDPNQPKPSDPQFAHLEPGLARIYAILSHRYDGGAKDGAARHNEHQP